jgi:hypothetical protein
MPKLLKASVPRAIALGIVALVIAACGGGGTTSNPSTTTLGACSTGTLLVLVNPVPGSTGVPTTTSVIVASMGAVIYQNSALAIIPTSTGAPIAGTTPSPPQLLVGPVVAPTPAPTATPMPGGPSPTPAPSVPLPFANPTYYQASGFVLSSNTTYAVEIANLNAGCVDSPIIGATFST